MTQFLKAAALAATLAPATLVPGAAGADSITLDAPMTGDSLQSTGVDMSVYYIALEGSAYEVVATYVGRDGKADPQRLATRFADFGHQCIGLHPVIGPSAFNQRDRAGQRAAVCGDHAFGKGLGFHGGFLHRVGRAVQRFAKKAVVWPWVYAHNQRHDRAAHRRRPAQSDRCLGAVAFCGSASASGRG